MSNPTTLVESFDGDAGAFTVSGPERYDNGLWLEEGTTNYIVNPSAEVDASWWEDFGPAGFTRTTAEHSVGIAAFSRTSSGFFHGGAPSYGNSPAASEGEVWTLSGDSKSAANDLYLGMEWATAGNSNISYSGLSGVIPAHANWQRDSTTATAPATTGKIRPFWSASDGTAGTWYADATQLEKKAYATSYADLTMGSGYSDGGGGITVRAASSASVPLSDHLNSTIGGVAFWATRQIDTGTEEYWITAGGGGGGNDLFFASLTSDRLDHKWNCNNAGVDEDNAGINFPIDTPTFFYMAWSDIDTWTYQSGGSMQTSTRNMPAGNWGGSNFTLQCGAGSMVVGPFMMLSRPLDDVELSRLEGTQNWSMGTLSPSSGPSRIATQFQLRPY